MKKLMAIVALLAFTTGASYAAQESYTDSLINKYTSGITQKEQQLRNEAAAKQKANDAKKAEIQKKIEADKKAQEAKKAEIQKQIEANKKAQEAKKAEFQKKLEADKKAQEAKKA